MPQRAPRRALTRLAVYLASGVVVTVITWLMFYTEPKTLMTGETNPAAQVPLFMALVSIISVIIAAIVVLRRPRLAANHFGVIVRPGVFRALLMPWVHIEEVTVITVPGRRKGDTYLLFACDDYLGRSAGDRPRFLDQAILREANRASEGRVGNYDLAVRLADFFKPADAIIDQIAGFAPAHVAVLNQLDEETEVKPADTAARPNEPGSTDQTPRQAPPMSAAPPLGQPGPLGPPGPPPGANPPGPPPPTPPSNAGARPWPPPGSGPQPGPPMT